MIRRIAPFPLAAMVLLGGCAVFEDPSLQLKPPYTQIAPTYLALEVVSLTTTHKTMFDHVATWVTGRNCSTARAEREGAYCVDWPQASPPPREEYCYASLAHPTCFAQPYDEGNDRLIGFAPASAPVR
ncbi:MAG: hypothetical protein M0006_13115 [Magnetospirillum sp.]|nr:hypothetical protein [Magnetospirillum sp.]